MPPPTGVAFTYVMHTPFGGVHISYVFYLVSLRSFSLRLHFRLLMHPFGVLHLTPSVLGVIRYVAYAYTFNAHTRVRVCVYVYVSVSRVPVCAILAESGAF